MGLELNRLERPRGIIPKSLGETIHDARGIGEAVRPIGTKRHWLGMTSIIAVYEGGVLRPAHPLPLGEGETVEINIVQSRPGPFPTPADDVSSRLQSAQCFDEWLAATKLLPPDDGGYDIAKALEENRIWSGERPANLARKSP